MSCQTNAEGLISAQCAKFDVTCSGRNVVIAQRCGASVKVMAPSCPGLEMATRKGQESHERHAVQRALFHQIIIGS